MGVPSYFGWIVKLVKKRGLQSIIKARLPSSSDVATSVTDTNASCHRLYFDFNCLIHRACREVWDKRTNYTSSNAIVKAMIGNVINVMHEVIGETNPRELIHVAIDGSVPMGKCKQQRYRRFKSVQETRDHERIRAEVKSSLTNHLEGDPDLNKQEIREDSDFELDTIDTAIKFQNFDFNAISPGTEFMKQLADAIRLKFEEWQLLMPNVTFIIDDSHSPGEGEHKIVHHVKSNFPGANETIVIYGLDADLIFLSLSLHHPATYLIRENTFQEPVLGSNLTPPKYLIVEISSLESAIINLITNTEPVNNLDCSEIALEISLPVQTEGVLGFDRKCLINDYIAINFFLGNDFVSRFFSLSIKNGGCEIILETYRRTLRERSLIPLPGFLTPTYLVEQQTRDDAQFGYNLPFLVAILERLAKHEATWFKSPDKYFPFTKRDLGPVKQALESYSIVPKWRHYLPREAMPTCDNHIGYQSAVENYYHLLFGTLDVNGILTEYLKSLIWTLNYYLDRCLDFNYYYPYNYAPLVADFLASLKSSSLTSNQIEFESSSPVEPYHQLMIILPPSSFHLLPEIFHEFPLLQEFREYFPETFELQYYGHRFTWECPPKIPILDAKRTSNHYQYLKRHLTESSV